MLYRTGDPFVKTTPDGAFIIVAMSFLPPRLKVAVVPLISISVALVCMRHSDVVFAVISSCSNTCLRPLSNRIPRLTDLRVARKKYVNDRFQQIDGAV